MATTAQKRASSKYDRNNTKAVMLKLNLTNDADILKKLDGVGNKQGYIKDLIRNDIRGEGDVLSVDSIGLLIAPVVKRYGIDNVELFGSYARGEQKADSDVDLMIDGGTCETAEQLIELIEAFHNALKKPVDIVMKRKVESDDSRQGKRLRKHIEEEGVVIYKRSEKEDR